MSHPQCWGGGGLDLCGSHPQFRGDFWGFLGAPSPVLGEMFRGSHSQFWGSLWGSHPRFWEVSVGTGSAIAPGARGRGEGQRLSPGLPGQVINNPALPWHCPTGAALGWGVALGAPGVPTRTIWCCLVANGPRALLVGMPGGMGRAWLGVGAPVPFSRRMESPKVLWGFSCSSRSWEEEGFGAALVACPPPGGGDLPGLLTWAYCPLRQQQEGQKRGQTSGLQILAPNPAHAGLPRGAPFGVAVSIPVAVTVAVVTGQDRRICLGHTAAVWQHGRVWGPAVVSPLRPRGISPEAAPALPTDPAATKSLTGLFLQVTNAHLGRAGITDCGTSIPPGMCWMGSLPRAPCLCLGFSSLEGGKSGKGNSEEEEPSMAGGVSRVPEYDSVMVDSPRDSSSHSATPQPGFVPVCSDKLVWDWFWEVLGGSRASDPAGVSSLWESLWFHLVSWEGKWHKGCAVTSRAAQGLVPPLPSAPAPMAHLCSVVARGLDPTHPIPGAAAAPTWPKGWQRPFLVPVPPGLQGLTPSQGLGPDKENSWSKAPGPQPVPEQGQGWDLGPGLGVGAVFEERGSRASKGSKSSAGHPQGALGTGWFFQGTAESVLIRAGESSDPSWVSPNPSWVFPVDVLCGNTDQSRAVTVTSAMGAAEVAPPAGASPGEGDLRTAWPQLPLSPSHLSTGTSLCPGSAFLASSCPATRVPLPWILLLLRRARSAPAPALGLPTQPAALIPLRSWAEGMERGQAGARHSSELSPA
ncbi:hypothetical protein DV515_00016531 [Chloebia gouldiae]|uniref:Uncharacterized protein n=1 Tax=Chloebia gouldiae TaxID=44316 RepID=A0A3L8RRW5_CHLGU|nr:hypothetical protein DV515_00016531 [Chloebia gouldiae]